MRHLLICVQSSLIVALCGCTSSSDKNGVDHDLCEVASLVFDTWPGAAGGNPNSIKAVNGKLYFQVNDGVHGEELWVYDPETGPSLLADIVPGSGGGNPDHIVELDGRLYFSANDESVGRELWSYDASDPLAMAALIADINSGSISSEPSELTVVGGSIYFLAYDAMHGYEPWVYDPASGAIQLADIRPGEDGSSIPEFVILDGKLYFAGHDSDGIRLWVYDPSAGATRVADIYPGDQSGLFSSTIVTMGDRLYFVARDHINGPKLREHDPETGAVTLLADIVPGVGGIGDDDPELPDNLIVFDNILYFTAHDGGTWRNQTLWSYTPDAGPLMLDEAWPGTGISRMPRSATELDGLLYFSVDDGVHGQELWVYDAACDSFST